MTPCIWSATHYASRQRHCGTQRSTEKSTGKSKPRKPLRVRSLSCSYSRTGQGRGGSPIPSPPTLVTSRPVIKDGQVQKGENGYTETYDQFYTVKAFGGLGNSVANHKKKGDKLIVNGEIRYSRSEKDGRTFYNTDFVADEIEFV